MTLRARACWSVLVRAGRTGPFAPTGQRHVTLLFALRSDSLAVFDFLDLGRTRCSCDVARSRWPVVSRTALCGCYVRTARLKWLLLDALVPCGARRLCSGGVSLPRRMFLSLIGTAARSFCPVFRPSSSLKADVDGVGTLCGLPSRQFDGRSWVSLAFWASAAECH